MKTVYSAVPLALLAAVAQCDVQHRPGKDIDQGNDFLGDTPHGDFLGGSWRGDFLGGNRHGDFLGNTAAPDKDHHHHHHPQKHGSGIRSRRYDVPIGDIVNNFHDEDNGPVNEQPHNFNAQTGPSVKTGPTKLEGFDNENIVIAPVQSLQGQAAVEKNDFDYDQKNEYEYEHEEETNVKNVNAPHNIHPPKGPSPGRPPVQPASGGAQVHHEAQRPGSVQNTHDVKAEEATSQQQFQQSPGEHAFHLAEAETKENAPQSEARPEPNPEAALPQQHATAASASWSGHVEHQAASHFHAGPSSFAHHASLASHAAMTPTPSAQHQQSSSPSRAAPSSFAHHASLASHAAVVPTSSAWRRQSASAHHEHLSSSSGFTVFKSVATHSAAATNVEHGPASEATTAFFEGSASVINAPVVTVMAIFGAVALIL